MFRQTKRRALGRRNFESSVHINAYDNSLKAQELLETVYPSRLSLYTLPPQNEITLDQFETWAIDRLKVLLEIEACIQNGRPLKETEQVIKPLLAKLLPLTATSKDAELLVKERKKDHVSHYILRLAFCKSEELRVRFVRAETTLFKIRFMSCSMSEQKEFTDRLSLPWEAVGDSTKRKLADKLYNACHGVIRNYLVLNSGGANANISEDHIKSFFNQESFLKVPFEYIGDLIATKSVYLHLGFGYVPQVSVLSLLASEFQTSMTRDLLVTRKFLSQLDEDDRVLPVLNHLSQGYVAAEIQSDFTQSDSDVTDITADSVISEGIARHYPLCGTNLVKGVLANHHLRFQGRQQLTLFLKGIGLNIDQAMIFWQKQFTSGPGAMTIDKFQKEYRYNIRHSYGLEGARINYRPYDCRQILKHPRPAKGEYHGCPYRDFTSERLVVQLEEMGINDKQSQVEVLDQKEMGNYQNACTKVFELTHKSQMEKLAASGLGKTYKVDQTSIAHPNQYFERSRNLERWLDKAGEMAK
ncbi:unnamed protein product [Kuraishia capsulata CBS 1993]|uniref:DNA primase large subunit n=1 Tax=Kuraishia capsulata CBS 1993 TaxID=1382522 RepID=W6MNU9_9ASCO|nr:uncharacterized protein KUCA_T00002711001 [Kuraishia capsulata CBS 1993]CDK26737.1 unnamed protein product [Kuraishia capsulata CBS 1993]